jgi:hypothetical protein
MAEKRVIELEVKTNAGTAAAEISAVGVSSTAAAAGVTTLGNASAATGAKMGTFGAIKTAITGLVPGLGAAEGGVMKLGAQFTKLLANPIVLLIAGIVVALKFVYEAFQSNVQGGKDIAAVWEGLSAVGTQVKDAVMGLVRAFGYAVQAAYKFITLDFKGAAQAIKNANGEAAASYKQLGDAASGKTFQIVKALEKEQQANNKAKKEQAVAQSAVNKLLVQSREILTDETASMADKRKALALVTKEETKAAAERVRIAQVDLNILKQKAKALGGQAEIKMKQEIRDATVALNEAETEGAMTGIKLNKQKKMLARQEVNDNKEAIDAGKERAKANTDKEKERVKEREDTLKKIKDLEQSYSDSLLSEEAKEIVGVQRKYKELYDQAAKHKLDISELKKQEAAEKLKIEDKYDQQINDKIAALTDTEQQKLYDAYQKEVTAAKGNKLLLEALEVDYFKKRDALTKAENDKKAAADLKLKEILLSEGDFKLHKLNLDYQAQQLLYAGNEEALKALKIKYGEDTVKINDEVAAKQIAADKAVADKKKETLDKQLQLVKGSFQAFADVATLFAGKNKKAQKTAFGIQKAANIAATTIDTYTAAMAAYKSASAVPVIGSVLAPIAAAGAVAVGLMNIKKIAASKFEGGGTPSADTGGGGGGGATAPTMSAPQFNVVGQSGVNQLASLGQQPVQAYVVSGQVTSQQSLDRNRLANATLGG